MGLALEFNGQQHYKFVSLFHTDENDLIAQQERDERKKNLCEKHGVYLIVIPYWIKDIEQFIKDEYNKYLLIKK